MFSDWRIREALEAGKVGVWRWDVRSDRLEWSPNLEAIHRLAPGTFGGRFASFADDIHPGDKDHVMSAVTTALETGGPYEVQYRLPPGPDGKVHWVEARGTVERDEQGAVAMSGVCLEVTDSKRAELELAARLKQQEVVAELGQIALHADDLQSLFDRGTALLCQALDLEYAKVLELLPGREELLLRAGVGWNEGLAGHAKVGTDRSTNAGFTLFSGEPVVVSDFRQETRLRGSPLLLDHAVVSGMSTIIPGPDGEPYGVLGVYTRRQRNFTRYDVNFLRTVANILGGAVQKAHASEVQALLYRELRHRVSNLFAQMLSIHRQTAKACSTIDGLVEAYERRLAQTAVAHDAISKQNWSTTSWKGLVETLLASFGDQVELDGPPTVISADHAFALSFVINELATNAVKYGALATDAGRLTVRWDIQTDPDRRLIVDWHELAARPIAAPGRTSFGTRLIDMMIKQRLQGEITRDYGEEGLQLRISLPFAAESVTRPLQMAGGD